MPAGRPELRGLSIVLLGDFNPTIFQPRWFAAESLLTETEADDATVGMIHPDLTSFQLGWIEVLVTRERCQLASAAQPYFERVLEIAVKTFELLRHTPIRSLGINHEAHYRASDEEKWHGLGHALAPKELWREFFPAPGLKSLTIVQSPQPDGSPGAINVTVEPSIKIVPGVYLRVNEEFSATGTKPGAGEIIALLQQKWGDTQALADKVFAKLTENL